MTIVKKEDGTDSDITNDAYEGNAMIEFPKVYVKLEPELGNEDKINIYISNTKIDKDYHCYAHLDGQENEMDYTYMSIYCGALVGNKLRSISGKAFAYGKAETLITAAKLNNLEGDDIWNIETFSDRFLLMLLLTMMCKTTMTQLSYGTGRHTASSKAWKTGLGDKQGFFYGKIGNSESTSDTLKTFGLENLWGNHRRYVVGLIKDANGMQKVKMYKTDGDSSDYNLTGEGYHEIGILSINSQQYVKKFYLNNEMCFFTKRRWRC